VVKIPVKQSAYSDYLYRQMFDLLKKQGGAFTLKELSAHSGLKVTCNMRRRINHYVATGELAINYASSAHGNSMVYMWPVIETEFEEEEPF